jgi:DNA primase
MTPELPDINLPDVQLLTESELRIKADTIIIEAGNNSISKAKAVTEVCQMLIDLNDEFIAKDYIKQLSKAHKISVSDFRDKYNYLKKEQEQKNTHETEGPKIVLPDEVDVDEAYKLGFFKYKNHYCFIGKEGIFKGSNFVITPLFHIYSKNNNKRMVEITNEYDYTRIVDIQSKAFVSSELFQQRVIEEGNYLFYGTKSHFLKILGQINNDFPICNELGTLGWQREGFFAFANGIYDSQWQHSDKFGIVKHNELSYFLPAFSCVNTDVREDDDDYENDRFFIFREGKIKLTEWCDLMNRVYGEKSRIAIAFTIASLFRDCIYEKYKMFPHLFLFGEKQSGKSQLGWSLSNLFMAGLPPFNLNSGTQVGFHRRLARVKNGIAWFDEYTNDVDEKRFQSLKAAYDGVGHEKGKMSKDNRTEITKVNSACVISGQYLPTRDDNALFTRSIVLNFEKKTYSSKETADYEKLKTHEEEGLSLVITEIIKHRAIIDKKYAMTFSEIFDSIKSDMIKDKKNFEERLLRNFVSTITPLKILIDHAGLNFGFTYEDIYKQSKELVSELSAQISSSEALATFWNLMEFMLDSDTVKDGIDFDIKPEYRVTVNVNGIKEVKTFTDAAGKEFPDQIVFIRFSKIHPLYLESHRKQYGVNGVDLVSLMHYVKHHKAFVGLVDSHRFSNSVSSCYAFRYNEMNVNLRRYKSELPAEIFENEIPVNKSDNLPF